MNKVEIRVPDLGGEGTATVVEVLAAVGEPIAADEALVAVETDKATSEIPSSVGGKLLELCVNVNDAVATGDLLAVVEVEGAEQEHGVTAAEPAAASQQQAAAAGGEQLHEVLLPDLGGGSATVVELLVAVGEQVSSDQALLAVETDKATAEVPSPETGTVQSLEVELGQQVNTGDLLARLAVAAGPAAAAAPVDKPQQADAPAVQAAPSPAAATPPPANSESISLAVPQFGSAVHASPAARKLARELGANLIQVTPSGPKGRITLGDLKEHVKGVMQQTGGKTSTPALSAPPLPDFSQFGAVEEQTLSGIKKVTGEHLTRSWQTVPLVTHFEECQIGELEKFRQQLNQRKGDEVPKTTPLAFMIKAVVKALQKFPAFNSSFDPAGPKLILKKYYHIGIAVETPRGLVVPVLRDADRRSLDQVSVALKELSGKARSGKLGRADMEGGSFTISSLGGLGGTNFTPLVNLPEAAILGVAKSSFKPVWNGSAFEPQLILPFSLSYDHRIIDGAEAARFCSYLALVLSDLRHLLV